MKDVLKNLFSLILPVTVLILVPVWIEPRTRTAFSAPYFVLGFQFLAGLVVILAGLFIMAQTITMFIRIGNGTLAPWSPTSKLVASGPYAHVRNPMILGVMVVLLGEALSISSIRILGWSALVFAINTVYFIVSEEPGLEKRFGEEYRQYKANVPRWLPRLTPWQPE